LKDSVGTTIWTLDNVQGGVGADAAMEDYYYPDATVTDQGVTGNSDTIKYAVDTISTKNGTIYLKHDGGTTTTTYTLTTSESPPANVNFIIESGAIFDGAGTLTFDNPGQIIAQPGQKIFGTSITVVFTNPGIAEAGWFGLTGDDSTDNSVALQAAITAAGSGTTHIPKASTRWAIENYLEIADDGATIICEWAEGAIRQETWGLPVFYVRADNVTIKDPWMFSNETRSTIADTMATAHAGDGAASEGTLASYNFSAGIFISAERDDKGSRFNVNRWHVEGFTVGIFARGSTTQDLLDVNLGEGFCDTVDWGVVAAGFQNMVIPSLSGVDIIRGGSGANPEHVLYITGGSSGNCSQGLNIGQLSARNVGTAGHAFQIKYTTDVVIGGANAFDCEGLFSFVGEVTGSVGPSSITMPAVITGTTPVIYVATDCDMDITSPRISGAFEAQGIAVDDAKLRVHNPHVYNTMGSAYGSNIFYVTGAGTLEVFNPKVEYSFTPTGYMANTSATASTVIRVYNPVVSGIGATCFLFQVTAGADATNSWLVFNPICLSNQPAEASIQINGDTGPYNVTFLGETGSALALATTNATPVINRATNFTITNGAAQNITDFDRAPRGHRFSIRAADSNTTFVHGANVIQTVDGNNYNLPSGKVIEFVERGGVFYETWRSV